LDRGIKPGRHGGAILVSAGTGPVAGAIALELAHKGAKVLVHYVGAESEAVRRIEARLAEAGVSVVGIEGDLSSVAEVDAFSDRLGKHGFLVDGLVCGCSMGVCGRRTDREWYDTCSESLKMTFFLSRRLGFDMARKGRGGIVLLGSCFHGGSEGSGAVGQVISRCTVTMAELLARALGPCVRVNSVLTNREGFGEDRKIVIGDTRTVTTCDRSAEIARMVCALMSETLRSTGPVLQC